MEEANKNRENKANWFLGKKYKFFDAMKRIKSFGQAPVAVSEMQPESASQKEINAVNNELGGLIGEFKSQTSLNVDPEKLPDTINGVQFYEILLMSSLGFNDGLKGVRNNGIGAMAKAKASFIHGQIRSVLQGRSDGLRTQIEEYNLNIVDARDELHNEKKFSREINDLCKKRHRLFSSALGRFYIIVGIFIMIADFPISLGIAKHFLNTIVPMNFWEQTKKVDVILFALGVTFLSVYFKIIYDDYINVSLFRNKRQQVTEDKEKGNYLKRSTIRFVVKMLILISLIFFFYTIGNVRNYYNTHRLPKGLSDEEITNLSDYMLWSFIGMTILLPLISGIALSVGFGIRSNIKNHEACEKRLEDLTVKFAKQQEEIIKTKTILGAINNFKDNWEKEDSITNLSEQFEKAYRHYYNTGHMLKFGSDWYVNAHSIYINELNSK